jgi:platelet-activating factor acetylhydrolase
LEFLRDVTTGAGRSIIQRCMTNEELLLGTPLDQLPDLHKPDDKWIGGRLKVPHEFKTRISAKLQRKLKRKRKHGFYNPGDEIWMHFKPDGGALQDWRVIHKCTTRQLEQQEAGDDSVQPDDKPETAGKPEAQTDGAEDEKWLGQHPALRTEDQ